MMKNTFVYGAKPLPVIPRKTFNIRPKKVLTPSITFEIVTPHTAT
jgi:hypothetical protein